MTRTIVIACVALALGLSAGALLASFHYRPDLVLLDSRLADASKQLAESQKSATEQSAKAKALDADLQSLRQKLTSLETQPPPGAQPSIQLMEKAAGALAEEDAQIDEANDQSASELGGLLDEIRRRRESQTNQTDRRDRGDRPDRAQFDSQRREQFQQFREQMATTLAEETERQTDPVAKQRVASINEYAQAVGDLWTQMREAETDEEREAIRQTIDQNREVLTGLVRDQQDYMLRQVASQYGITTPDKQDAFVNSLRDTTTNPLFRVPQAGGRGMGGFGQGGGWRGGGFGGGGGRSDTSATPAPPTAQ